MFKLIRNGISIWNDLKKPSKRNTEKPMYQIIHNGKPKSIYTFKITNFIEKINNLIIKNNLDDETGLRFVNKRGISTFGLRTRVDIILCNFNQNIIDIYENVKPQKMTHYHEDARFIYIFIGGFVDRHNIQLNDVFVGKKVKD